MSLIVPSKTNTIKADKKIDAHIMDIALVEYAKSASTDDDGNLINNSIRAAKTAWDIALYAESPRDRLAGLRFITERIGGKPKVIEDDEKEELPEVVFRLSTKDSEQLKKLVGRVDVQVENNADKIIVDIDGEPTMEF